MSGILILLLSSTTFSAADTDEPQPEYMKALMARRKNLGRTEKFRIMVDKVLTHPGPGEPAWREMSDEIVQAYAQEGFNVIVPRVGGDNPARVRAMAHRAAKHGVFTLAWLAGTLHLYEKGERWDKQRMIWKSGGRQDVYSPNMDRFWDRLAQQVLRCAEISVEEPAIIGVFLDHENYWETDPPSAEPKEKTLFGLSYDAKILGEFAAARKIELPDLQPAERYPWLVEHGLHDAFSEFQINSWRARCRKLRQQVDAINPAFQFVCYPTPMESLYLREAACQEWGTEKAPYIVADWKTYGRPQPRVLPQDQGLAVLRGRLTSKMQAMSAHKVPHQYISGIDPMLGGYTPGSIPALTNTDPEFCGRNAVMISQTCNGYWVFYEGPRRGRPDHAAYLKWFGRANRAIVAGDYGFWKQERETPDLVEFRKLKPETDRLQITGKIARPLLVESTGKYEIHPFEGASLAYLSQFDAIVLVSYTEWMQADGPFPEALRAYVEQGGGLFLGFDTSWFMKSAFPQIAMHADPVGHDRIEVNRHAHVIDTDIEVVKEHAALGNLKIGTRYTPMWREHMVFATGPKGTVLMRNEFGDPVCVAGTLGKGRVVFAGSYYDKDPQGPERQAYLSALDWLAGAK